MTTDVVEEVVPTSEAVTPESPEAPAAVVEETAAPAPIGEETHETEPAPPPRPLTLSELNRKAEKEGLSPDEYKEQQRLQQADSQSRWQHEQQRAQIEAEQKARDDQLLALKDDLANRLAGVRQSRLAHVNNGTYTDDVAVLLDAEESRILGEYHERAGEVHLTPVNQALNTALLALLGDTVQNRRAVAARNIPQKLTDLYQAGVNVGKYSGPGEGYVVKAQKEYDADIETAKTRAVDDFKSSRPDLFPGGVSVSGGRTTTGVPTVAAWSAMTFAQRQAARTETPDIEERIASQGI